MPKEQLDIFLIKFAPWECEQLGCVLDYLFDRLSIGKVHHCLSMLQSPIC